MATYPPAEPRRCPVCGTVTTERFARLRGVPVNCSAIWQHRADALRATRADIELALCDYCGMIFNCAFDGSLVDYSPSYDNTLAYSPTFRAFAADLAARLVTDHGLRNRSIVEIGCGQGDFLDELCRLGSNRGRGFDPSATERGGEGDPVAIRASLYTPAEAQDVDFVCCRHVLEHISSPRDFIETVRLSLAEGGSVYFEVPNGSAVLQGPSTWDLVYPHCSYFTEPSLRFLLEACGFEVQRVETVYGDQFLGIEARASTRHTAAVPDVRGVARVTKIAQRFDVKLRREIAGWSRLFEYVAVSGGRVALWGAGAKSTTFLNVIPGADRVCCVVDLNPRKQGTFVPALGQSILAPDALRAYDPEIVVVLNPLYVPEIEAMIAEMGLGSTVMTEPRLPIPVSKPAARTATV